MILSFSGEETVKDNEQLSLGHTARGGRAVPAHFYASLNSQYSLLMLWGRELGLIPSTAGGPLVLRPNQESLANQSPPSRELLPVRTG